VMSAVGYEGPIKEYMFEMPFGRLGNYRMPDWEYEMTAMVYEVFVFKAHEVFSWLRLKSKQYYSLQLEMRFFKHICNKLLL